jgi:hypothetical protein
MRRSDAVSNWACEPVSEIDAGAFPAPRTVCCEHAFQHRLSPWTAPHMTGADIAQHAVGGALMVLLPWSVPVALLEARRRWLRMTDAG